MRGGGGKIKGKKIGEDCGITLRNPVGIVE